VVVLAGMFPVGFQTGNPGIRRQQGHLMRGFTSAGRSVLFDQGEETRKWGRSTVRSSGSRSSAAGALRDFAPLAASDVCAKSFLKRSDVLVEIEKFSGERMFRG